MELRDYVRVLRRSWLLVLTCALLGGLLAATATWRATKIYAATVTMVVSSSGSDEGMASAYQGGLLSEQRVKSYANLVASERVAAAVIDQLNLDDSASQLRGRIEAQAVPDTVLLRAVVRDADPHRAQSIADAVGEAFSAAVARIERPAEDQPPSVRVRVWEKAKLPAAPVSPQPVRNIALGVLLGLMISIGAALLRHRLDTSVTGESDVRAVTGLPNLAMIAYDAGAGRRPLIIHANPHSPRAEAFRQLRTNLQFVDVDTAPRSILISSSLPGEGKTTTICNLAIILAQGGARVCLVEGDLRRPSFGEYLGIESAAGLTSVLIGAADLDDVLQPWGEGRVGDGRVEVLPSGPVPPNPSELLGSRNMADLIDVLCTRFDFVLIDAPPLLPVTDAAVLATRVDGVLLVARAGRTRREQIRRAADALRAVDARVIGSVLNMVPTKGADAYYYGRYEYAPRARHARSGDRSGVRLPGATDRGLRPAGVAAAPVSSTDTRPASGPAGVPSAGARTPATSSPGGSSTGELGAAGRKAVSRRAGAGSRSAAKGSAQPPSATRPGAAPGVESSRGGVPVARGSAPEEAAPAGGAGGSGRAPAGSGVPVSTAAGPAEVASGSTSPATAASAVPSVAGSAGESAVPPGASVGRARESGAGERENPPVVEIVTQREPEDRTAPLAYGASDHGSDRSADR
ncbi:non-specific protein-tyrosine kinase [Frankia sp. Hr75.2]|nr:non-specific protein-tyrosine kinase [Frankia sp. Hr75.2]